MNSDIYFLFFFGKREVTSKTAEGESHTHPWKQQGPLDRQGEWTRLRMNEEDTQDTRLSLVFL